MIIKVKTAITTAELPVRRNKNKKKERGGEGVTTEMLLATFGDAKVGTKVGTDREGVSRFHRSGNTRTLTFYILEL